ncbi:MAG: HPF/RaiA family ribosome-associated protein [Cyanobacteria bacterium J06626_14]
MQLPIDISYRNVEKTPAIDDLIRSKAEKLEEVCDHIMGCHIAIEQTHTHPEKGSPYRVRIDLTVPPNHEIVAEKSPDEGIQYDALQVVIRDAFEAARRQLKELTEKQQNRTKSHPEQVTGGIITKLFLEEGYGFLKAFDDQEIYFHRNSVLHDDFERLTVGTGVQFFLSQGEKGPQASTVRLINKPGVGPAGDRN